MIERYNTNERWAHSGVRDSVNVTTDVTIYAKPGVISDVPERINLGLSR